MTAGVLTAAIAALVAVVLGGCGDDLGPCDPGAARQVVYDREGFPAYEGQALVHASCGSGAFCHSAEARGLARVGAPAGLDFDMAIASVGTAGDPAALARLSRGHANVIEWRDDIHDEVEAGTMPPWGEATLIPHANVPRYRRIATDGSVTRLPHVDSIEGVDVLRNWLACGAPIVERTEGTGTIGDVVPVGPAEPR